MLLLPMFYFCFFLLINICEQQTPPKLRILLVVPTAPFKQTHFNLHRRLAEVLETDRENVDYVHLLALTTAIETVRERRTVLANGRFVVQFDSLHQKQGAGTSEKPPTFPDPWQERLYFNPEPKAYNKWRDVLLNHVLLDELNALNFNMGIVETTNTAGLTLFETIPSIQLTVATSSIVPYINLYEHLGYTEVKKNVPDVNNAEIGDHEVVGKTAAELKKLTQGKAAGNSRGLANNIALHDLIERQKKIVTINAEILQIRHQQDVATWESYSPAVTAYLHSRGHVHAHYTCPTLKQLFQRVSYFFVNTQPSLGFPILETLLMSRKNGHTFAVQEGQSTQSVDVDETANNLRAKLRFMGGIGLPAQMTLDETTRGILERDESVLKRIVPEQHVGAKCFGPEKPVKGTILAIFGTAVPMARMPMATAEAFHQAFLELGHQGYQVIWKAKDAGTGQYSCDQNIYINNWVPQPGILAHPNTKLFLSHCGNNSVQEAALFGVPIICFPFFGDQYYNAEAMASREWAKVLNVREKDSEKLKQQLLAAVEHMLASSKSIMEIKSREQTAKEFLTAIVGLREQLPLVAPQA